ncbi:hypothetical protein FRC12_021791, partial [Ceratobasidium sp. 428]
MLRMLSSVTMTGMFFMIAMVIMIIAIVMVIMAMGITHRHHTRWGWPARTVLLS